VGADIVMESITLTDRKRRALFTKPRCNQCRKLLILRRPFYGIMAFKIHLFTEHQILLAAQKMCTASEMPQLDSLVSAAIRGHEDKKSGPYPSDLISALWRFEAKHYC